MTASGMTPARILLTGFGPFGGHAHNPSGEAAAVLGGDRELLAAGVVAATLPVERRQAGARLSALLSRHRPHTLVLTGLSATRPALCLERLAVNRYRPAGRGAAERRIVPGGPETLRSTLPWSRSLQALRSAGVPVRGSDDAGTYTCNLALYLALTWSRAGRLPRGGDPPRRVGFVHLPPTPQRGSAGAGAVPLAALVASLRALLAELAGT